MKRLNLLPSRDQIRTYKQSEELFFTDEELDRMLQRELRTKCHEL